jgi:hypothetical protein
VFDGQLNERYTLDPPLLGFSLGDGKGSPRGNRVEVDVHYYRVLSSRDTYILISCECSMCLRSPIGIHGIQNGNFGSMRAILADICKFASKGDVGVLQGSVNSMCINYEPRTNRFYIALIADEWSDGLEADMLPVESWHITDKPFF